MQENPTQHSVPAAGGIERSILDMLISDPYKGPWANREIELEAGNGVSAIEVEDALAALRRAGLVHRCDEFAWAARAAYIADELRL